MEAAANTDQAGQMALVNASLVLPDRVAAGKPW
jgi:hypothetical protein